MERSDIQYILNHLSLSANCVTNIYHHGSWVYGTNTSKSDRDILIVTRSLCQRPLKFWTDFDYFHDYDVYKLLDKYDVCVYSVENFEILLEKNYLIAVQCVFLPDENKIKEDIDFRRIYLEKYYDIFGLKRAAFYEMYRDIRLYSPNAASGDRCRNSMSNQQHQQQRRNYVLKHFFHGIRYLDFVEQIIQTKSIHDYKRVSHLFNQMKDMLGDPGHQSSMARVFEFACEKSNEFKSTLDAIVPTNNIRGIFEAHITFDCKHNSENVIEKLKQICENPKYRLLLIQLEANQENDESQQVMTSSFHIGEYPSIIEQIKQEVIEHFQGFYMVRIKIKSATANEGVPETDVDKKLFWNNSRHWFEFSYHMSSEKDHKGERFQKIINTYGSNHRLNWRLSRSTIKQVNEEKFHYMIRMDLFKVSRRRALEINDEIMAHSMTNNCLPSEITHGFCLYNSVSELDPN